MRIRIQVDGKPLDINVLNDVCIKVFDEDFAELSGGDWELVYKINKEGQSIDLVDLNADIGDEIVGDSFESHWSIFVRHSPNEDDDD